MAKNQSKSKFDHWAILPPVTFISKKTLLGCVWLREENKKRERGERVREERKR
jgi:hypothetical protein